jgi:predicted dithiol-disulfide oxidoreductase (DUF899 family)
MTTSQKHDTLHDVRFPGESGEYRKQRDELLRAEMELRRHEERVSAQRRTLPLGGEVPTDYVFDEWDRAANRVRQVRLSELFEDGKDTLFLYSHMFIPGEQGLPLEQGCPSCTSINDAIDGEVPHITQLVNYAVAAKVPIEQFRAHADARGWRNLRLLSSANNTYNADYHAEDDSGTQLPIANVFVRGDGVTRHSWASELMFVDAEPGMDPRHVDFMWPLWSVVDRTPGGRGEFHPSLTYG